MLPVLAFLCVPAAANPPDPAKPPTGSRAAGDVMPKPAARPLTPITYADLPGWADDDHLAAFKAFLVSCPRLAAAAKSGNKAGRTPTPPELLAACEAALALAKPTRVSAREFFESRLVPQRVVHDGPAGLLTGYYKFLMEELAHTRRPLCDTHPPAPGRSREHRRRDEARHRRRRLHARPHDASRHRTVRQPRRDRRRGARGPRPRAALARRPGRRVLPADPGLGPHRAAGRQRRPRPLRRQERAPLYLDRPLSHRQGPARRRQDVDGRARPLAQGRSGAGTPRHAPERVLRVLPRDAERHGRPARRARDPVDQRPQSCRGFQRARASAARCTSPPRRSRTRSRASPSTA